MYRSLTLSLDIWLTEQQRLFSLLILPPILVASWLIILKASLFSRPKSRPTYRVRNIPERYSTCDECRFLIEDTLSTPGTRCNINVRTFASNFERHHHHTTVSRMVTFDLIGTTPSQLKPNSHDEWSFKVFDFRNQQGDDYITIDTHFNGFTILSSPEEEDHEFDLVAISGLGSHAWGSFKKRSESSMWLVDKLRWPQARIMIYGYRSPIMGSHSRKTLDDIAKTFSTKLVNMRNSLNMSPKIVPLVFIAHSLGGLVVKQALVNLAKQSRTESRIQQPFHSTCAILFFGVPCRGLDGARLGLAAMARGQSTEGFLSDLRNNAPMVHTLAHNFLNVVQDRNYLELFSFYETVESGTAVVGMFGRPSMRGPKEYWVGQDAAFNGREVERNEDEKYSIPLDTDHSGLVKCEEEESFKTISDVLRNLDWASITRSIVTYKKQGGVSIYGNIHAEIQIPRYYKVDDPVEYFRGRDEFVDEIHDKLNSTTLITASLAIWGLSGIGKTQTALKYASKYQSQYSTICLFNARSEKELTTSMTSFFEYLNRSNDKRLKMMSGYSSSERWEVVKRWFEEGSNWLIIYDNVDPEPDYKFGKYLPRKHYDGHRILIGVKRAKVEFANHELWMTGVSERDAVAMLLSRAGFLKPTIQEKLDATRIVRALDNMPCFIEYAAAYIRKTSCLLKEYLVKLRNKKSNMLLEYAGSNPGDKLASWELQYNELQAYNSSMTLLKLFAYLDDSRISKLFLERGSSDCVRWSESGTQIKRSPEYNMVDENIRKIIEDPELLDSALEPLVNASFVHRDREGTIKIPNLVQRLVIERLGAGEPLSWTKKAICFVSHGFPEDAYLEHNFEALRTELAPHVFRCMDHARLFPPSELYDVAFQLVSMLLSVLAGSWKQMELIDYAKLLLKERNNVYYRCLAAKWEAYMMWHKKASSNAATLLNNVRLREEMRLAAPGTALAEDFLKSEAVDYRGHAALGDLAIHQAQFLFMSGLFKEGERILKRWKAKSNSELELRTQLYIDTALAKSMLCQDKISGAVEILERLVIVPEAHGTGEMQPEKYNWATALLAQGYCALGRFDDTIALLLPEVTFRVNANLESAVITSDYRLYLAEAYTQKQQYEQATKILLKLESVLETALQVDNPRAKNQLVSAKGLKAMVLHLQKSWNPARMAWLDYLNCLSVDEADITDLTWKRDYFTGIGIFSLAMVYYHLGNTKRATQFIETIEFDRSFLVYPVGETDYTKWLQFLETDYRNLKKSWLMLKWQSIVKS